MNAVSTYSIVARDPATGDLGVATASKFLAVGAVVPVAQAGVGAVATQSYANTSFGPRTLAGLAQGIPLALIHQALAQTDTQHALRQYGLVDKDGHSLSFTGAGSGWSEATDKALRALAGVENLEERLLEPGWVDRVALEHLEANT